MRYVTHVNTPESHLCFNSWSKAGGNHRHVCFVSPLTTQSPSTSTNGPSALTSSILYIFTFPALLIVIYIRKTWSGSSPTTTTFPVAKRTSVAHITALASTTQRLPNMYPSRKILIPIKSVSAKPNSGWTSSCCIEGHYEGGAQIELITDMFFFLQSKWSSATLNTHYKPQI